MNGFPRALGLSLVCHAVVAAGLAAWIDLAPSVELAQLDLTSVELSFAEDEADDQPAVPLVPLPPPPDAQPPEPRELPQPPVDEWLPVPPEAEAVPLPEPAPEPPEPLDTPPPTDKPTDTPPDVPPLDMPPPTPAVAPKQARIDAPPKPLRTIKPDYPKGARQRGEEGDVVLELHVTAQGAVDEVKLVRSSGFGELDSAALRAARTARFTPAKRGRDAVASTARLTLTFTLKK